MFFLLTARVGLKGPTGTFCVCFFEKKRVSKHSVYSSQGKTNLKNNLKKDFPTSRLAFFSATRQTGNTSVPKDGLISQPLQYPKTQLNTKTTPLSSPHRRYASPDAVQGGREPAHPGGRARTGRRRIPHVGPPTPQLAHLYTGVRQRPRL